jgi:hypothetical protein
MRSFYAPCVNASEFAGSWIEPNTEFCRSEWVQADDGCYHIGRILKANPGSAHRAYATWQPCKTGSGFGPSLLELDFKYNIPAMRSGQWFSLLTLARSADKDDWNPVCVNIDQAGRLYLMHVPTHGFDNYTILGDLAVSQNVWHHLDVKLDFRAAGSIVVSLNGTARLHAAFPGLLALQQAHAGLYADGSISSGWVANSNLRVQELPLQREIH